MNLLRVALVTPTFWPIAGHRQESLNQVAEALQSLGAEVVVITERVESDWAARIRYRDLSVHRVDKPSARPWSKGRFGRVIERTLRDISGQWDAIIVFGPGEELAGLAQANPRLTNRLIVRLDRPLRSERETANPPRSLVTAIQACDSVLGNSDRVFQWLSEAGISHPNVGVAFDTSNPTPTTGLLPGQRETSRAVLAALHPNLSFDRTQPVVVCAASMFGDPGMFDLLDAWRTIRRSAPRAQLVIAGEGSQTRALWSRIHEMHLQGSVVLPGWFDDWFDLVAAADVYVHPLRSPLSCPVLVKALGWGAATVVSSAEPICGVLRSTYNAQLFQPGSSDDLAAMVLGLIRKPELRRELGKAAAETIRTHRSPDCLINSLRAFIVQPQLEACAVST